MNLKNLVMIMVATCLNVAAFAQEGQTMKHNISLGVGTNVFSHWAGGIDLDVGYSYNFKGFVIGVSADWYNNLSGKEVSSDFYTWTQTSSDNLNIEMIDPDKHGSINNVSVLANAGYDVFRFLSDKRHHLTPHVGLGYSWMKTVGRYRSPYNSSDDVTATVKSHGFEVALGIGYSFNILRNFALGITFDRTLRVRKQNIIGVSATYSF